MLGKSVGSSFFSTIWPKIERESPDVSGSTVMECNSSYFLWNFL